jgi:SH3-like domain-containing protein
MDARSRLLVFAIGLCLLASAERAMAQGKSGPAKQAEPDLRYVEVDRVNVYAGPREDYYPTSFLSRGESVTVYEQTEDGWLAIRPPKGSFSWLPASQGFLLPGGRKVEVTEAEAVSWIGS